MQQLSIVARVLRSGRTPCLLALAAFAPLGSASAQQREIGGVGITVFSQRNFTGRTATFRNDVDDLAPLGMNDVISSLRVGRGERWEVCVDRFYRGRCVVVSGEESDLRRNDMDDLISSMRRIRRRPVPPTRPPVDTTVYIILYDQPVYRGTRTTFRGESASLGQRRPTRSVTVGRGAWRLCSGRNFTGRCVNLTRSTPRFGDLGIGTDVRSLRPVRLQQPR